ncbi:MAG: ROK family protein [Acidobacteria bacterium]|nr:ROK family protein [Acidobacteriota bacterium]
MRIGIDMGGTKIAAVVLGDDGEVVWERRVSTPRGDYDGTLNQVAALVGEGDRAAGRICTVGVGIPGAISRATGLVKNANSTWLIGRSFGADLEGRLSRKVRLANDANCLAMSEATDGAGAGATIVFGVILGTGVGGGVVVHGKLVEGANSICGEWGHNPLPWPEPSESPGELCYCGRRGCIETWLSGPGLAADYQRAGCGKAGEALAAEEIAGRAEAGEERASEALNRWESRLARALATVVNLLDPDVIVVGGGLSAIGRIYQRIPQLWGRWVFSDTVTTRIVPAKHGAASGVRGAAWLWPWRE